MTNETPQQVQLLGGLNVDTDDYAVIQVDVQGRIIVVCPHCAAEGKADPSWYTHISSVYYDGYPLGWEPRS